VDTRTKIIGVKAARAAAERERGRSRRVILVTGCFDPLLAEHARALEELARSGTVFACVSDPERPLLAWRARAELAAALSAVSYVVDGAAAEAEAAIQPDEIVRREDADARVARELIRHVHERQGAR